MLVSNFERFFEIPNFFYKTVGIIINDDEVIDRRKRLLIDVIFYIGIINMDTNVFAELINFKFSETDLLDIVTTLSYVGFCLMGNFKMFYIRAKKQQLKLYLHDLSAIFPRTEKDIEEYEMKRYLEKCTRITVGFSVLYMLLIWTFNLTPLVEYLVFNKVLDWRNFEQDQPYTLYIPWDYRGNWSYYLVYFSECMAGYVAAAGQIANDLMLSTTATQVIMHYDFIARKIEKYKAINVYEDASATEKNLSFLCYLVGYHNKILHLSDQMNSIFGISLFLNFMTSSFVICFVGFQMTIDVPTDTLVKLCIFLVSSTTQIFLISYYGEGLKNASENIAMAVFQHDWHNADLRYKKMLTIIAMRAQKPAMLTATSFLPVSQTTMTDILQLSYKFFTLLQTMYGE